MTATKAIQYRIVFSDIDGTLIDSNFQISQDTKQKIQELYRMGVPFVLVSARMHSGILPVQNELEIKAPVVCYSGAMIFNEHGECMQTIGIDYDRAVFVDAFVRETWPDVSCSAFCGHNWITNDIHNAWIVQEQRITTSVPVQGKISDFITPRGHVNKFLCMGEPEQIAGLDKALKERYPALTVYRSKDTYLEVMDGTASKSGAVRYLCGQYGIPVEAAVSFGDNFNDVDMLTATGAGFVMGNAPEEVKRQVQNVTADNDHEGVLAGLRQLDFAGIKSGRENSL